MSLFSSIGSSLGGLGSGIMDVLGGGGQSGYGDVQQQLQQAMDWMHQNFPNLQGYSQAGSQEIPGYQNSVNQMQDPFAFADQVGQHYQQSANAKNSINDITRAMNNAGAASGMAGSPALQRALAENVNNISQGDQQNYLNDIMGIHNQYMQGANSMMNNGLNAANSITGQGNAFSGLYGDIGNAQLGQSQSNASAWGNLFGGAMNMPGIRGLFG